MKYRQLISALLISLFVLSGCQSASIPLRPHRQASLRFASYKSQPKSVKTIQGQFWKKMELIRTNTKIEPQMHKLGRHRDPGVIQCFGTPYPKSSDFCLHDAGIPAHLKYPTPVLLIHGANTNATRNWADPEGNGSKTGLMQYLKQKGYHVFAVTFANKHGDNLIWAQHIHQAIKRIRELTQSQQVDAIGHSKGGFALRVYTSNLSQTPVDNSLRKAIFIGTPHRGLDYTFRHSTVHWGLMEKQDNPILYAPLAWTKTLWKGRWTNTEEWSFSSLYFPGQAQMLARWDKVYSLPTNQPDWMTTYYGGQGFVSRSPGIKKAIQEGGNLVEKLKTSPVDSRLQVALLAGNSPTIPGILNELSGPSDGIVFVKSALAGQDLIAAGAALLDEKKINLHHLALVSAPSAMKWVEAQLQK